MQDIKKLAQRQFPECEEKSCKCVKALNRSTWKLTRLAVSFTVEKASL